MALPTNHELFKFTIIDNGYVTECTLERRYVPGEVYHAVIFKGSEYFMRINEDTGTFKFIHDYMNSTLRRQEDSLSDRIFAYDHL